ncbi:energy transducer TonB [Carboxylicivirga sp. A043]|uniref:energy transducer TonB n=1 Tax=Carboxylicivirga litoralis TaxID=2816963 RepID=UPI0021CAF751|nr:energy transducer TonB [Carboxylicivirga sp. A043]MCU4155578.1 energy transducer TonB [Carboxylicivirga sp. A043]
MKKMLLSIGICFFVLGLVAQEQGYAWMEGSTVVPPQFKGTESAQKEDVKKSPICCYLMENLEIESSVNTPAVEGTVVIEFTVNTDGSLSNFKVINHVSYDLEFAVIDCIRQTEGMWKPGKVDNRPSSMEKRVQVRFDAPDNPSFEEIARNYYSNALQRFMKAEDIQKSKLLSQKKIERKANRRYNQSLNLLEAATVYIPNDPTLAFWKARNYEQLGMYSEMQDMLDYRKALLSMQISEQKYSKNYDMAIITLK